MKQMQRIFKRILLIMGVVLLFCSVRTAEAKKYYSLSDVGLSGSAKDEVDYAILSIRGNKVRYQKYQISGSGYKRERVGKIKTAKLTSKTKCYVGDSKKVPDELRQNGRMGKKKNRYDSGKKHLVKKYKDINTVKWIYRVQKRKLKKYISGRNNEIKVVKGKVTKIAVRLSY